MLVYIAGIVGVALAEDDDVNTVKETRQTQLNNTPKIA